MIFSLLDLKWVSDLQALPDDLKHKLSLDEDLVSSSSPKEALLRASADRVAMRNKNLKRYTSFEGVYEKALLLPFQSMCPLSSYAIYDTEACHTRIQPREIRIFPSLLVTLQAIGGTKRETMTLQPTRFEFVLFHTLL